MKQNVSAPVAVIVIVLAISVALVVFSRVSLAPPETQEEALPQTPPSDPAELMEVRQGLAPLGITAVVPPLQEDRRKGARVASVAPGSPADRAGIVVGDFITSFDGRKLIHPLALASLMPEVSAGARYEAVIVRDGKEQTVLVEGIQPPGEGTGSIGAGRRSREAGGRR